MSHGCVSIQRGLERLYNGTERNVMKCSKGKCRLLHQGRNNPIGAEQLKDSSAEKQLGVLVDNNLTMHQ